ncbi:DUF1593 domain-containing protein [Planctomycetes bacterium K23_9]|uniref:REJ domain protein n=1 Tax=Stieleria marina TaxID=1930275 RepID=A0A517NUZ3_9BACT|nr:hypothetical protein K239x_29320 [Planctomycetes bacterium K23_9]
MRLTTKACPLALVIVGIFMLVSGHTLAAETSFQKVEKPRLLVLTDIENEPDDAMSLVRLLTYSNVIDIEGLVATTSCWQRDAIADWRLHEIVDAYGEVRDNLLKHEAGYPTHSQLKSLIKKGIASFGMEAVGEGKDSEGSDWVIKMVDKDDDRPIWIPAWGGANILAQALFKVKKTRSPEEVKKFVSKIRTYTISDQDDSGPWIRETFPDLFYIVSPGYHENGGNSYPYATWVGIAGDRFHGKFSGANFDIVDNPWLDKHIRQNHGPLGAQHPHTEYLMEGDTPSFFHIIPNGLGHPEHPDWGGWGGRYELYTPAKKNFMYSAETRPIWTDTVDAVVGVDDKHYMTNHATIWRWREDYQFDFAARIDWSNTSEFDKANHRPVAAFAKNTSQNIVHINAKPEEKLTLSAAGSSDPDDDKLSYRWFQYREAGTLPNEVKIDNSTAVEAKMTVPKTDRAGTRHVILEVKDNGTPSLRSYRRVIVSVGK